MVNRISHAWSGSTYPPVPHKLAVPLCLPEISDLAEVGERPMAVVLVPVIAASMVGLIGTPAVRLMISSTSARDWARARSMVQSRL